MSIINWIFLGIGAVLFGWCIFLTAQFNSFRQQRQMLSKSLRGTEHEEVFLNKLVNQSVELRSRVQAIEEGVLDLRHQLSQTIRTPKLTRYNAFQDVGGEQSFTMTLLDPENTGIIFTSQHGREGTRIYAKSIDQGVPKYQLSEEEFQILQDLDNQ